MCAWIQNKLVTAGAITQGAEGQAQIQTHMDQLRGIRDAADRRRTVHATLMRNRMAARRQRVLKKLSEDQEQNLSVVGCCC